MRHVLFLSILLISFNIFADLDLYQDSYNKDLSSLAACKSKSSVESCNNQNLFSAAFKVVKAREAAKSQPGCTIAPEFATALPVSSSCTVIGNRVSYNCMTQSLSIITQSVISQCGAQARTGVQGAVPAVAAAAAVPASLAVAPARTTASAGGAPAGGNGLADATKLTQGMIGAMGNDKSGGVPQIAKVPTVIDNGVTSGVNAQIDKVNENLRNNAKSGGEIQNSNGAAAQPYKPNAEEQAIIDARKKEWMEGSKGTSAQMKKDEEAFQKGQQSSDEPRTASQADVRRRDNEIDAENGRAERANNAMSSDERNSAGAQTTSGSDKKFSSTEVPPDTGQAAALDKQIAENPGLVNTDTAQTQGQAAVSEVKTDVEQLKSSFPDPKVSEAATAAGNAPTDPNVPVNPESPIIKAAQAKDTAFQNLMKNLDTTAANLEGGLIIFGNSIAALQKASGEVNQYLQLKKACAESADRANLLCVERPGAKAAKTLMDVAGPVIATFNSASKSCSGTADVTKLMGTGLAIAKGVCAASKVSCDSSCGAAAKMLTSLQKSISVEIPAAEQKDIALTNSACPTMGQQAAACVDEAKGHKAKVVAAHQAATPVVNDEIKATPGSGSAPSMVAGCAMHGKDIALLALDLLGVMQAQKSSKECAKKLAASGNGSVSTQQFCEKPENKTQIICKCKDNNMAEGCPGHIATVNPNNKPGTPNRDDSKGSDSRGNGGASAFAGPGVGGDPSKKTGIESLGGGATGDSSGGAFGGSGSAPGWASGGDSGAASAGGAKGGAAAAGGADEDKKSVQDKKKWSLGGLMDMLTGGGGKGAAGGAKSGGLPQQQVEAVKRTIAAEKLRAEISGATGKSNWEKVNQRYLQNKSTLLSGQ